MFDSIPSQQPTGRKERKENSDNKEDTKGDKTENSSVLREIQAQESDRQLSFADNDQVF